MWRHQPLIPASPWMPTNSPQETMREAVEQQSQTSEMVSGTRIFQDPSQHETIRSCKQALYSKEACCVLVSGVEL